MPAFLLEVTCLENPSGPGPPTIEPPAAADWINRAFEKSDIAEICHAIGAATRLYDVIPAPGSGERCTTSVPTWHDGKFAPPFARTNPI